MSGEGDFRTRTAALRRERMRARLLEAVIAIYAADGRGERAVVDDLVRAAGVSRGTFYKYFDTLEAAVVEVGRSNADGLMRAYVAIFGAESDPLLKVAGGPMLGLAKAAMDPRWAGFTARVDFAQYLADPPPLYAVVRASLEGAQAAGALRFDSLNAAFDASVGLSVQGTRRAAYDGGLDRTYMLEVVEVLLRGLGAPAAAAKEAAAAAWSRLEAAGLPWWRPIPRSAP